MKKAKAVIMVMFFCSLLFLFGCTQQQNNESTYMDEWLRTANLEGKETPEELYEKAKKEGILTIYSVSTRIFDVVKSFEKQYPGLSVKVYDLRADELVQKVRQIGEGAFDCDIVFCTNVDGSLTRELIPNKQVFKYTPYDIADKMLPECNNEYLSVMGEIIVIGYNSALHDECPVKNWWELTEKQWYGKVYAPNPAKSVTTLGTISMMFQNEDMMEQSYYDRYGVAFEPQNGEGAAETYVRRLLENGLNIVNSSDETAEAIGAPGTIEDNLGIIVSSKVRQRDIGYTFMNCYDATPVAGFANPGNIMLAGGAKNINSAKLFIRWILGERDGQGEGYKPFLQNGAWSTRIDVQSASPYSLDEMNLIYTDGDYVFENREWIIGFWEKVLSERD